MGDEWKYDRSLEEDLQKYVRQGLKRTEILDYMWKNFSMYNWSLRTLDRRLRYLGIYYQDYEVDAADVKKMIKEEMDGPGALLGYRAMHKKVRQLHGLKVSRDLIHGVMQNVGAEVLEERRPCLKKKKPKGQFLSPGPNFVHSLDGHDKLMGYQNSTFPIAIYGCMDTCSRKMLWTKVWSSNSDPQLIGRFYLEYLHEHRIMAKYLRLDRGSETGIMAAMHAYLHQERDDLDPVDTILYGPSTSNQIERWWREVHERLEKFFKVGLNWLRTNELYNPDNDLHRSLLGYIMVPLIQREIDDFVEVVWNTHRIRAQKDVMLPCGIPNHIYEFPEQYNLKECGFMVALDELKDVASHSGVLEADQDYVPHHLRSACEKVIANPLNLRPTEYVQAYLCLKDNVKE